ncbi:MAG: asparagine synthase (glutamine-hydrolyzing) [Phycisphaerales bacterium]|nr:asparagine synthase (glutamine-hydrolyzing) [Phycisphaerales bacterium]
MCGILGLIAPIGSAPGLDRVGMERLRDRMMHRGPDDAGYLDRANVLLAHRRLAVIDPTPAGHQPMTTPDGRFAIVYNGELYNDAELRLELQRAGHHFYTTSDTETILAAVAEWGWRAIHRLRGMYALGIHDSATARFLLARDPLGVKPLYIWRHRSGGTARILFASEIQAIMVHPGMSPRPDMAAVSAYLTTIRTTIGERTLFGGVHTLLPGEMIDIDLRSEALGEQRTSLRVPASSTAAAPAVADRVRSEIGSSIRAHLRSDVPTCCLLSGGLDSSIIAAVARSLLPELWTYCAGARFEAAPSAGSPPAIDDLDAARRVADLFGTRHAEAVVSRELFAVRWPEMVDKTGLPLSTPNEVAIHEVARRLRSDGKIVTISGEGADELFGGYDVLLGHARAFEGTLADSGLSADDIAAARARFQADDAAWVPISAKPAIVSDSVCRSAEADAVLLDVYTREYSALAAEGRADEDPLQVHLRFQRRINLAGLLLRLDSATMLAGVEGRTPFADAQVAGLAESLPMHEKFGPGDGPARTKACLRRAFTDAVPEFVLRRPKASFPLPFQTWCADQAHLLALPGPAREFFSGAAIETVRMRAGELWSLAWPIVNIAMWARRWWG